jgi:hypothetical protein
VSIHDKTARPPDDAGAQAYVSAWRRTAAALEAERLRSLQRMTEIEAAQRFALLLSTPVRLTPRSDSGLVEQQRIFSRLRNPSK